MIQVSKGLNRGPWFKLILYWSGPLGQYKIDNYCLTYNLICRGPWVAHGSWPVSYQNKYLTVKYKVDI